MLLPTTRHCIVSFSRKMPAAARSTHKVPCARSVLLPIGLCLTQCWLRELADKNNPTFGQRGKYSMRYRTKMLRTRKACTDINTPGGLSPGWACPPTHVPWTSGTPGTTPDLSIKWQTGGGWGNMRIHRLAADGLTPVDGTCTRNGGAPCDESKLDHAG